jgi:frataxin-like iron-binding protein CyaY
LDKKGIIKTMCDLSRESFFELIDEKLEEIDEMFSEYEGKIDSDLKQLKMYLQDARDIVSKNM